MTETLSIELDTDVTECGEVVTGFVRWGPLDPVPRNVVVQLRYHTEGRGDTDSEVVDKVTFAASASGTERFEVRVPADGPMSFDGSLIRVVWEVRLSLDVARQRDTDTTVAITVLPRGGLASWAQQVGEPPST